jgi:hypothetical protein
MQHVWGRGEVYTGFWWRNLRERVHLIYPGIDERIILKRTLSNWGGVMNWIYMAQDWNGWRALVNAVTNLRFS